MVDPALGQVPEDVLRPWLALLNRCLSRRANQRPSTRDVLAQLLQLRDSLVAQAHPVPPVDLERAQVGLNSVARMAASEVALVCADSPWLPCLRWRSRFDSCS
jgi:hypothetical protein